MADTGSTTTPTATKVQPICSFWGRLLALAVDLGLLFVVGSLLGVLFADRLAQLGVWGSGRLRVLQPQSYWTASQRLLSARPERP